MTKKRELVKELSNTYDIKILCRLMDMPGSSYYYVSDSYNDVEIRDSIERACLKYPRYGHRRITSVPKEEESISAKNESV